MISSYSVTKNIHISAISTLQPFRMLVAALFNSICTLTRTRFFQCLCLFFSLWFGTKLLVQVDWRSVNLSGWTNTTGSPTGLLLNLTCSPQGYLARNVGQASKTRNGGTYMCVCLYCMCIYIYIYMVRPPMIYLELFCMVKHSKNTHFSKTKFVFDFICSFAKKYFLGVFKVWKIVKPSVANVFWIFSQELFSEKTNCSKVMFGLYSNNKFYLGKPKNQTNLNLK